MNNFINMENLKNKLDKYEIKDEKNKYVFRADFKYMISSSIFFMFIFQTFLEYSKYPFFPQFDFVLASKITIHYLYST